MYRSFLFITLCLNVVPTLWADTPWSTQVTRATLQSVMPEADVFSDKLSLGEQGEPPVYSAYKTSESGERELLGYVFLSADMPPEEKGYSAPIDMLIGLGIDGRLTGLKVLNYVESFRYSRGDFLASEGFQEQFQGKSIDDNFRLRHDLDGVTNATISSWAIARAVRNASRRVAQAYLNYVPQISDADIWAANAASQLAQLSWQDLLDQGLVVKATVPTPMDSRFTLTIAYMGRRPLGEFLIGKADYDKAERDASIRFDTPEMVLFAVGGDESVPFQQQRLSVQRGDSPPQRIHPRRIVSAGGADKGAIAGNAAFAGAIVMEQGFNPSQPFSIHYQPLGNPEPTIIPYQLSGMVLSLVKGEPILSPEEAEQARLAAAPWHIQLRHGILWQDTNWWAVSMLVGLMALVTIAFFRKSSRLRWSALSVTLVYLGFYNSGFLSVSHVTGLLAQGPITIVGNLPLLLLVLFTLITTILWGRLFCASLCPFGALQDFISRFMPHRWRIQLPALLHRRSLWVKYGFLTVIVAVALIDNSVSIFQYFEPFGTLFYFSQSFLLWTILVGIILGCVLVERFYCRYVCPLGAALALIAVISPWRIQRVPQCNICKVCEHACPTGAIRGPVIDFKECVRCDICEIKLIEQAGTCRHSVGEIVRRGKNDVEIVKLMQTRT